MSDGQMAYVAGKGADDDLRAKYTDEDGTMLRGNAGDDILRGGGHEDILVGGGGNDQMWGGGGADQFRFFGNLIDGTSDTDYIRDLKFGEGDTLVFGNFGAGTFADQAGVNAFASASGANSAAVISSWQGIVNAVNFSDSVTATRQSLGNDNLVLRVTDADGQLQNIVITGGWSQYAAAGGVEGA